MRCDAMRCDVMCPGAKSARRWGDGDGDGDGAGGQAGRGIPLWQPSSVFQNNGIYNICRHIMYAYIYK